MHHDEFVRRIEGVAANGLAQQGAERAIATTLVTLGELLGREQARRLAAQLPLPEQPALRKATGVPGNFGAREFVRRVAVRRRLARLEALDEVRAVLHVVEQAVSSDEREQLRAVLSDERETLRRPPAAAPQRHEARR